MGCQERLSGDGLTGRDRSGQGERRVWGEGPLTDRASSWKPAGGWSAWGICTSIRGEGFILQQKGAPRNVPSKTPADYPLLLLLLLLARLAVYWEKLKYFIF